MQRVKTIFVTTDIAASNVEALLAAPNSNPNPKRNLKPDPTSLVSLLP